MTTTHALEERIAHLERALEELSALAAGQADDINRLKARVKNADGTRGPGAKRMRVAALCSEMSGHRIGDCRCRAGAPDQNFSTEKTIGLVEAISLRHQFRGLQIPLTARK